MSVPGVGYATALSFKAAVDDDPGRFKSSRTVGARFGLPRGVSSQVRRTIPAVLECCDALRCR
ncbi:transposase [Rhizobium mongolense]|uniref:transposase n=1 Tax=Rhizobium TaxID=379 RepID=UPI003558B3F9